MKPIAFFCAEYGIQDELPLYAGGLGVLAGDYLLEAGSQGLPFIAVGIFYTNGFIDTNTAAGDSTSLMKSGFQIVSDDAGQPLRLAIDVSDRVVKAQVWTRAYGSARLYLIDTNIAENSDADRKITAHLYDSNMENKMMQELILGIGGIRLLRALKIDVGIYHLNEGHTSFVALALAAEYLHDHPSETSFTSAVNAVRSKIVATKHTILSGAGMYFTRDQFKKIISHYFEQHRIDFEEFFSFGTHAHHPEAFATTRFLLAAACRSNGVSMVHVIFEKQKHPMSPLISITNGINPKRWRSPLWPKGGIGALSDADMWQIRNTARRELLEYVKAESGVTLDEKAMTIVWARRFAAYKRPYILFSDLKKLEEILSRKDRPVQIIISGMAHKDDKEGTEMVEKIKKHVAEKAFQGKIVYLPHYSIDTAKKLVVGADVWLNTPERGIEACGTSGMKSGLNGGLECSVRDGWIEEVDWNDKGWILPEEGLEEKIYDIIDQKISPMFYERTSEGIPARWIKDMRGTMEIIEGRFTTKQMLEEYLNKLYFPHA